LTNRAPLAVVAVVAVLPIAVLTLAACGGPATLPDAGTTAPDAGVDAGLVMDFSTGRKVLTFLEGKTLVMSGADIPSSPNGLSETFDLGANTQCYRAITLRVSDGGVAATIEAGHLTRGADGGADACDHTVTTDTATYTSRSLLLDNAVDNGRCFDVTIDYAAFGEEGRGRIAPDGTTVTLELYFRGKALHHRCDDGELGAPTVELLVGGTPVPFSGDALQRYRVE
jgi:hypothetical protein